MMKVLMISRLFFPHVGGVEKVVFELSKNLIKRDIKVTILTEKYNNKLKAREIVKNIKIIRLEYPKVRFIGLLYIWRNIFSNFELIRKSDIIHIHDVFIWYLPFRLMFPFKSVFITFHGWEGKFPVPTKNILIKKLAKFLTQGNISVGKFIKKYYGVSADKISYGGVEVPKRVNYRKKNKSIVYVGRLEHDTGLPVFLNILTKLKGYEINFCGDGPLKKECAKFGIVHGFVDPSKYQAKAQICFSSGYNSILEAMINKCLVVVAYDNALKRDYYTKSPFKDWIVSGNSKSLLNNLLPYLQRFDSNKRNIHLAYVWASKQTWSRLTNEYLSLWGLN